FGEGYHNYHHTFAWDYRNGIRWYHWDPTKWLIKACSWLRLTSDLRKCSSYRVEMTRIAVQYKRALLQCDLLPEPASWRSKLEAEYEQLVSSLNAWSEAQQSWYHARSEAISHELHHEIDVLKHRYEELKVQLQLQRQNWKGLLSSFGQVQLQAS